MRAVGIDIAKAGLSAVALAVDGVPQHAATWKHAKERDSEPVKIEGFYTWLHFQLAILKADVIAVEELAVFMSKPTIRTLSRREGVALLVAKQKGAVVLSPSIGSSRNIVLGIPANSKKEVAWEATKKMYPDFNFGRADQGGMDKADAMVHALAAPTHLERRR